jgi:chromosome segregation ATPase
MIGLDGSWVLSEQLALYRTLDTWNRAREDKSRALSDAAWRNQYNDLVNRYNRLLQDAHRLADVQDRALNGQDGQIAELKTTNANLEAQIEKLTVELADSRARVKLLRGLIRELRPETYRSVYDEE